MVRVPRRLGQPRQRGDARDSRQQAVELARVPLAPRGLVLEPGQLRAEKDRWRETARARLDEMQILERLAVEARKEAELAKEEARRAWGARSALIGALGICGASWEPMTGDGPEAVRCTQVCSLASGHKGAHGWGKNVQATTVQASKDPA